MKIDDRNNDQGSSKREIDKVTQGGPKPDEQQKRKKRCDPLDQGILNGNGCPTVAAFSSQQQVTDERKVVVERDGGLAPGTMGARCDDGLLLRQPADTNIQKTTDHCSKQH
jgi:hypothetical protein